MFEASHDNHCLLDPYLLCSPPSCRAVIEGVATAIYVAGPLMFLDQVQVRVQL